ncbi:extracellular tyrosine-protein kinase PKDCC-like [Mercenaria mercenaria]|uniref:extracellular tyrosine-protein kinase PKDCC-like n=1 Tax=Mercenaria mercenaria TaxID=6596 RepID=UPI00234E8F4F|nr:extracellular tyrosine-protein kinase PKDCC-like [Mercenaria mercenaria]
MFGYVISRRLYKTYIVLPLIIYACLMYRMLENTCRKQMVNEEILRYGNQYDPTSRKIMQVYGNHTENLLEIVEDYIDIQQRRQQVIQSLRHFISSGEFSLLEENSISGLDTLITKKVLNNPTETKAILNHVDTINYVKRPRYLINCSNIHEVRLLSKIGHGVSKQTFKADFRGMPVAVKMVTRHQSEVKSCIDKINEGHQRKGELRSRCFVFPTMKLMKEILLLEQVSNPGFARLLGYCVRNEESETTDLTERGIVSVFELGERVMFYNLQTLTWQHRLRLATELAEFLNYLEHSPLGSLRIRDFKEEHFLMINDSLKMIDLDDVDNLEPACHVYVSADAQDELIKSGKSNGCEFDLTCDRGLCVGFNAKQNMKFMNKLFFKKLLFPTVFPKIISQEVGSLLADIDSNKLSGATLSYRLYELQNN